MKPVAICLAMLPLLPLAAQARNLTPAEAAGNIGQAATVCGYVASVTRSAVLRGRPTFLNFDQPYPNQSFMVTIWGGQRDQLPETPESLAGKRVCVTGTISGFHGRPEMFLQDPSQLKKEQSSPQPLQPKQ